jgi:hypothetical protein
MDVTLAGKTIVPNFEQFMNALAAMLINPSPQIAFVRLLQNPNAPTPRYVTLPGIETLAMAL